MKRILDVVAFGGAVVGSILIAANIGMNVAGYAFFLCSSIATVILLSKSDASKSIYWTQLFFVVVNIIGIMRY